MNKRLKRTILSGIILSTLSCCNIAEADFKSTDDTVVSKYEVYAYDRDDYSSEKIGIMDANREVYRILSGENLDLVNSGDYLFFVPKDSIEVKEENDSNIQYTNLNTIGITTTEVNLRVGPGTDNNAIVVLDEDTKLELIAKTDNGWYLVDYGNLLGFVSSDYVQVIDYGKVEEQLSNLPSITRVVETTTEVNVRKGPSTDYDIITTIPKGYRLSYNKISTNGWYEVEKNGNIGYICGDYLKELFVIDGECLNLAVVKEDADAYGSPYGDKIGYIPQYEVCSIYGEVDNYYYVECQGHIGFINKNKCIRLKDTFVVVDISDQEMKVYNGTEVILRSDVVTGKDTTPTSRGIFSILEKESPRELIGDGYDVWVDYWMRFHNGEGLHDLKRSAYGGEIYHNNGSHGCINLPKKVASKLYTLVNKGDSVIVHE